MPESGQSVLPGDVTDVPDDAVRDDSNPVDVTDVSVDLLNQIRQGYVSRTHRARIIITLVVFTNTRVSFERKLIFRRSLREYISVEISYDYKA